MNDNFGNFNQQQSPGPMGDIQNQVARALNGNGNGNNIFIPGGQGEPVFAVPSVRTAFRDLINVFRWAR